MMIKKLIISEKITLVAVTKGRSPKDIEVVFNSGITNIGESYVQEAMDKFSQLDANVLVGLTKHFIGRIQSNKIKKIVQNFDYIQSLDNLKNAELIDKECSLLKKKMSVLIQVNISGEKTKNGVAPEQFDEFYKNCKKFQNIDIKGIMVMGPNTDDKVKIRKCFRDAKTLADKYRLEVLSMGMSDDYTIAIEEGATMVRIGKKLFG